MENVDQAIVDWLGMATAYQQRWWTDRYKKHRHYVNARQIGTTVAMAVEAGAMRVETGRPQVFIAPSRAQAEIFHHYQRDKFGRDAPVQGRDVFCLSPLCKIPKELHDGAADVYVDSYGFLLEQFDWARIRAEAFAGEDGRITWLNSGYVPQHHRNVAARRFARDDASRELLTIWDAVRQGLTTVDPAKLQAEYRAGEFARLFECVACSG